MKLYQLDTGAPVDVPDSDVPAALQSGKVGLPAGSAIPYQDEDGSIKSVPIEQSHTIDWSKAAVVPHSALEAQELQASHGGALEQAKAGLEGLASGATLGASDVLEGQALGNTADIEARRKANPWTAGAGQAVGALAPSLLAPEAGVGEVEEAGALGSLARIGAAPTRGVGLAGGAVEGGIRDLLGAGAGDSFVAALAKNVAAKGAGAATEGAIYGATQHLDEQMLGDPDANGESLLAATGHGALLGLGLGAGLGAVGELGGAAFERVVPRLHGLAGDTAARAVSPGAEAALEHLPGGARAAGQRLIDDGMIHAGETSEQIAAKLGPAADEADARAAKILATADAAGTPGPSLRAIVDDTEKEIAALRETPDGEEAAKALRTQLDAVTEAAGVPKDSGWLTPSAVPGATGESGKTGDAGAFFRGDPGRDERIHEYLGYGYLEANEYMRGGPAAYAVAHGQPAADEMGQYVAKLNADLSSAPNKVATVHRITSMTPEQVQSLRAGSVQTEAPWFVTEDASKVAQLKGSGFDAGEGTPVQLKIEDHPVSVSDLGKKRPGEALIPAGTDFQVASLHEENGVLVATLKDVSQKAAAARARIGSSATDLSEIFGVHIPEMEPSVDRAAIIDAARLPFAKTADLVPTLEGPLKAIVQRELDAAGAKAAAKLGGSFLDEYKDAKLAAAQYRALASAPPPGSRSVKQMATAAGLGLLTHGPAGAAGGLALGLAKQWAAERGHSTAAVVLDKLAALRGVERAAQTVDRKFARGIAALLPGAEERAPLKVSMVTHAAGEEPYAARVAAVQRAAADPGAAASAAVGDIAQHAPKVAKAFQSAAVRATNYLAGLVPKTTRAPSITPQFDRPFVANAAQKATFNRAFDVAHDPAVVLKRAAEGRLTQDHVKAMAQIYPARYARVVQQVHERLADLRKPLTTAQKQTIGTLLGRGPDPEMTRRYQAAYQVEAPKPTGPQQPQHENKPSPHAPRRPITAPARNAALNVGRPIGS